MSDLNDRRVELLKAIVEEYVRTAEPVGSKNLVKRYKLRISPATVRNEMAVLVEGGFLDQPHTSAGRIPAPMGIRYYIRSLMEEESLPVLEEVAVKQRLMDVREDFALLLRHAVRALAERMQMASVLLLDNDLVMSAGAVHLLENPEFYDIDVTRSVLTAIDNPTLLREIFSRGVSEEDIHILMGDEIELANFGEVGTVFADFNFGNIGGTIAVFGPCRMHYPSVIPTVRYFSTLLNELSV
jgi:transcriptional regulator of heat shock response